MSGIDPARAFRESIRDLVTPENTVDVEVGTRGAADHYERVVDGDRLSMTRTAVGGDVGIGFDGRPRGAVTATGYLSMNPIGPSRALYSPELSASLRYDHTLGEGGRVGGRLGLNNTVTTVVNVGVYVGVDRGVSGGSGQRATPAAVTPLNVICGR